MPRKILIAPVGVYERRLWKAIVRFGPNSIYFIKEGKTGYSRESEEIWKLLAENAKKYLMLKEEDMHVVEGVDLGDFAQVYETLTRIIETERSPDRDARVVVDVTSTPKVVAIAAAVLGRLYDIEISYVPPLEKITEHAIDTRRESIAIERTDEGGDYILIPTAKGRGLEDDELRALVEIGNHGSYPSMNDLIRDIARGDGRSQLDGAYRRRWIRVFHDLQEKNLIELRDGDGLTKPLDLTPLGRGVLKGAQAARSRTLLTVSA